jgi:hypothetical protein
MEDWGSHKSASLVKHQRNTTQVGYIHRVQVPKKKVARPTRAARPTLTSA